MTEADIPPVYRPQCTVEPVYIFDLNLVIEKNTMMRYVMFFNKMGLAYCCVSKMKIST